MCVEGLCVLSGECVEWYVRGGVCVLRGGVC